MSDQPDHPLLRLPEEDLNMVQAFVLVSGSIKDLASQYGVSYPTMRQRLNRLIERLQACTSGGPSDPMADYLADLISTGQISPAAARRIRELHKLAAGAAETPQPNRTNQTGAS